MTTAQQIIDRALDTLDDSATGFVVTARALDWINEAQRNIGRRTESFQKTATVAVVAGTQEYTLSADVIRVYRVEASVTGQTTSYALQYRDFNAMDEVWFTQQRSRQSDHPSAYTMWGYPPVLKVTLWPTPSAAGSLKVYYYSSPADITAVGDTVTIPMGWEDLVVDYIEYKALRKARDPRWQEAKSLFEEKLDNMILVTRRFTDQGGRFVTGDGVGPLPSWLVYG